MKLFSERNYEPFWQLIGEPTRSSEVAIESPCGLDQILSSQLVGDVP